MGNHGCPLSLLSPLEASAGHCKVYHCKDRWQWAILGWATLIVWRTQGPQVFGNSEVGQKELSCIFGKTFTENSPMATILGSGAGWYFLEPILFVKRPVH